jgi:hypothetical protein
MKNFILLLLILLSFESYSQVSSLSDIQNISSLSDFRRAMAENYFQLRYDDYSYKKENGDNYDANDNLYGYKILEYKYITNFGRGNENNVLKLAKMWAMYNDNNTWWIDIDIPGYFQNIFEEIKQKCDFEMVWGTSPCYKCPNSKFDGMLCVEPHKQGGMISMQRGPGYTFSSIQFPDYYDFRKEY